MPTAILDLEYTSLPDCVDGLERYAHAQVLVRVAGRPAAWVRVPVVGGVVQRQALLGALRQKATGSFWQAVAVAQMGDAVAAPAPICATATAELPSVTVAVCTRDRPDDLRACLAALARLPDDGQEIVVVDSASQTGVVQAVVAQFPAVRLVRLERPGLNVARNAAMAAATGEIVLFIDDDAIPDAGWLRAHRRAFSHPLTMASTGLTLPLELETEAQEAFEMYGGFSRGLAAHTFRCQETHPLAAAAAGAGVNMAVRRSVVQEVGWFDEALDAGTPTQSGGEIEFFARLLARYYRIEYTPEALNWHRHRRSHAELRRTVYGYGTGVYAFWTQQLTTSGEVGAVWVAGAWFLRDQLPAFVKSLARRPGGTPWPLPLDELRGCVAGPQAYWASRRALRAHVRQAPLGERRPLSHVGAG